VNDDDELVEVSPRHTVRLAAEYAPWIERAPTHDFVVRTILRREANGLPLMSADIVIAGEDTRQKFPVAGSYPLHFRKTYFPGRLHGDPRDEFERHSEAATLLGLPPPIGWSPTEFRSCLLPGTPYDRLSPFGLEPEGANLTRARDLPLATAAGLYRCLEEAYSALTRLHAHGLSHGDPELHNFIVCPSPLETLLIDFEAAVRREALSEQAWEKRCRADLVAVLREAICLQCALGPQRGPLAEAAWAGLDGLFKEPGRFRRAIGSQRA
jgi:hypothetical protein